jgi:uncharacterized membrane protein YgcG
MFTIFKKKRIIPETKTIKPVFIPASISHPEKKLDTSDSFSQPDTMSTFVDSLIVSEAIDTMFSSDSASASTMPDFSGDGGSSGGAGASGDW